MLSGAIAGGGPPISVSIPDVVESNQGEANGPDDATLAAEGTPGSTTAGQGEEKQPKKPRLKRKKLVKKARASQKAPDDHEGNNHGHSDEEPGSAAEEPDGPGGKGRSSGFLTPPARTSSRRPSRLPPIPIKVDDDAVPKRPSRMKVRPRHPDDSSPERTCQEGDGEPELSDTPVGLGDRLTSYGFDMTRSDSGSEKDASEDNIFLDEPPSFEGSRERILTGEGLPWPVLEARRVLTKAPSHRPRINFRSSGDIAQAQPDEPALPDEECLGLFSREACDFFRESSPAGYSQIRKSTESQGGVSIRGSISASMPLGEGGVTVREVLVEHIEQAHRELMEARRLLGVGEDDRSGCDAESRDGLPFRSPKARGTTEDSMLSSFIFGEAHQGKPRRLTAEEMAKQRSADIEFAKGERSRFALLPIWNSKVAQRGKASMFIRGKRSKANSLTCLNTSNLPGLLPLTEPSRVNQFWAKHAVDPSSSKRAFWDTLCFMFVIYDVINVPLVMLDLPDTDFQTAMQWITRIYWNADLPMTFFTGYLDSSGTMQLQPSRIARRYVRSWLALDLSLVGIDWVELLWTVSVGESNMGQAARWLHIIRMVRLLRIVRLRAITAIVNERIRSEGLMICIDMMMNCALIVAFSHVMGCLWYGLGIAWQGTGWVALYEDSTGWDMHLGFKYATALQWALSQFTGGMGEVVATNIWERVYALVTFLIAFLFVTVFQSAVTSSMTRLQILTSAKSKELVTLRWYLQENEISANLAARILRNATTQMQSSDKKTKEEAVQLLKKVSEPLRIDLHFELFSPIVKKHPFFERYIEECPQVMRKVCHQAVSYEFVAAGDDVFDAGEVPKVPKMYIVSSGAMSYVSFFDKEEEVVQGDWVSEANLWMHWMHVGTLTAKQEVKLCVVSAKMFQDIVGQYNHPGYDPRLYAEDFLKMVKTQDFSEITDLRIGKEYEAARRDQSDAHRERQARLAAEHHSRHSLRRYSPIAIRRPRKDSMFGDLGQ